MLRPPATTAASDGRCGLNSYRCGASFPTRPCDSRPRRRQVLPLGPVRGARRPAPGRLSAAMWGIVGESQARLAGQSPPRSSMRITCSLRDRMGCSLDHFASVRRRPSGRPAPRSGGGLLTDPPPCLHRQHGRRRTTPWRIGRGTEGRCLPPRSRIRPHRRLLCRRLFMAHANHAHQCLTEWKFVREARRSATLVR